PPQEIVRRRLDALAAEPGYRVLARIPERTEERGEEHDFGEDEPHHSHAERAVDPLVVDAAFAFSDEHPDPPTEKGRKDRKTDHEHGRADTRLLPPSRRTGKRREKSERADDRPWPTVGNVVFVCRRRSRLCVSHER